MLTWQVKSFAVCFLLIGCLCAGGCSRGSTPEPLSPTHVNLQRIGNAYAYACTRLKRPPENLEDLTPSLQDQGVPEDILRSPNDGERFAIVWGVELRKLKVKGNDLPIIAYERLGKDGKRHVLRGRSEVLLLSESALKEAAFPPGYRFPF
jgi:hypothetical protein